MRVTGTLIDCYRRRTGQSEATVSRWLSDETWFDAKEAVSARLADAIDDQPTRIAASVDLGRFKNPPAQRTAPAAGWDKVIRAKFAR